jgi:hypothetical protein
VLGLSQRLSRLPPFAGRETLRLLCALQAGLVRECLARLARAPPAVLGAFARQHCRSEDDWCVAVHALAAAGTPGAAAYVEAVKHASTLLSVEALLRLLPAEANVAAHAPILAAAMRRGRVDAARNLALADTLRAASS